MRFFMNIPLESDLSYGFGFMDGWLRHTLSELESLAIKASSEVPHMSMSVRFFLFVIIFEASVARVYWRETLASASNPLGSVVNTWGVQNGFLEPCKEDGCLEIAGCFPILEKETLRCQLISHCVFCGRWTSLMRMRRACDDRWLLRRLQANS